MFYTERYCGWIIVHYFEATYSRVDSRCNQDSAVQYMDGDYTSLVRIVPGDTTCFAVYSSSRLAAPPEMGALSGEVEEGDRTALVSMLANPPSHVNTAYVLEAFFCMVSYGPALRDTYFQAAPNHAAEIIAVTPRGEFLYCDDDAYVHAYISYARDATTFSFPLE